MGLGMTGHTSTNVVTGPIPQVHPCCLAIITDNVDWILFDQKSNDVCTGLGGVALMYVQFKIPAQFGYGCRDLRCKTTFPQVWTFLCPIGPGTLGQEYHMCRVYPSP